MIIRPPTYNGIELSDHIALCCRLVLLDHSPDFCQQRLRVLFRRRYQQLATILAQVLAEEVESILNAGHAGLFG